MRASIIASAAFLSIQIAFAADLVSSTTTKPTTRPTSAPSTTSSSTTTFIPAKLPVPNVAALDEAATAVNETFADDFSHATSMEQKSALSVKLRELGCEETSDTAGKYVLFNRAIEIATAARDLSNAGKAIDELGKSFQVDASKMTSNAAESIWKALPATADYKNYTFDADALANEARSANQYDLAKQLEDLALAAAKRSKDQDLISKVMSSDQQIAELRTMYEHVKLAETILRDKPTDGAANLKVGKFYCFIKGDWKDGLSLLAKGSDSKLKKLADNELQSSLDSTAGLAIADGWWGFANNEVGMAKNEIRSHAYSWYERIGPNITGLANARAEKREKEFEAAKNDAPDSKWLDVLRDPTRFALTGDASVNTNEVRLGPADESNISTVQNVSVPFTARFEVKTDSTNIRIQYGMERVIFNWEMNQTELRFHSPSDGEAHPFPDRGKVPVNQWQDIGLVVHADYSAVFVSGKEIARIAGDFGNISNPVSVQCSHGSIVSIRKFQILPEK